MKLDHKLDEVCAEQKVRQTRMYLLQLCSTSYNRRQVDVMTVISGAVQGPDHELAITRVAKLCAQHATFPAEPPTPQYYWVGLAWQNYRKISRKISAKLPQKRCTHSECPGW
jgi:hypothetical protein